MLYSGAGWISSQFLIIFFTLLPMLNLVNLHTSYLVTIRQPSILAGIDKVIVAVLRLSLILFPTVYVKLACVLLAMLKDIKITCRQPS